jgi:hypothetical protein
MRGKRTPFLIRLIPYLRDRLRKAIPQTSKSAGAVIRGFLRRELAEPAIIKREIQAGGEGARPFIGVDK